LTESKSLEISGNMEKKEKRKQSLYLGKCVYYLVAQEGENGEVNF
jgi:hypothetical protein